MSKRVSCIAASRASKNETARSLNLGGRLVAAMVRRFQKKSQEEHLHIHQKPNPILTAGIAELFPKIVSGGPLEVSSELLGFPPSVMPVLLPYEQLVLAGIVRWLRPKRILEIGMSRGMGTYVLAANAPEGAKVVSVDLPAELRGAYTEKCLRRDEIGRIALQSRHAGKVIVHFEDSKRIDPDRLRAAHGHFDLVLIDGDHSYEAVKSDSELAFRVLAPSGVVLWHDLFTFLPPAPQRGVFQYLSELAMSDWRVRHIAGTYFGVMKSDWTDAAPGRSRDFKSGEGPFAERIVRIADADWRHAEWHGEFLARQNAMRVFDLEMNFNVERYAEARDTDIPAPGYMLQVYIASLYHADKRIFGSKLDAFNSVSDEARVLAETLVMEASKLEAGSSQLFSPNMGEVAGRLDSLVDLWLKAAHADFFEACGKRLGKSKRLGFVLTRVSYKAAQQATALRKRGWSCFLISIEAPTNEVAKDFSESFDGVLILPKSMLMLIRALRLANFDLIHYHASMHEYVAGKHIRIGLPETPLVTEFDDITSVYASRRAMRELFNRDLVDLDLIMEGELCRQSDGVLHQFDPGIEDVLRCSHGGLVRAMGLQPIWESEVKDDTPGAASEVDPHRLVFTGAVLPMGNPALEPLFPSYGFLGAFESLAEQGLKVDIMLDPGKNHDITGPAFSPYHDLAQRFEGVHFGKGVPRSELAARIRGYGFGLVLMRYNFADSAVKRDKFRFALPNKVYGYIAAGLPVLVSAEFEALARLVEENGIGIALRSSEIGEAQRKIDEVDYPALRKNVQIFRRRNLEDQVVGRLISFYQALLDDLR